MYKFINGNQTFYYCYCTNTNVEGIINIPESLAKEPAYLWGDLFDIECTLGQSLFDALELAKKILDDAKIERTHGEDVFTIYEVTEAILHKYLEHDERTENLIKPFLKQWFVSSTSDPINADYAIHDANICIEFIETCIDKPFYQVEDAYIRFCQEHRVRSGGAETVYLNLDEYLKETWESTDNILELLMNHFLMSKSQRDTIIEEFLPYMDHPDEFCFKIKAWACEHGLKPEPIITYHIYKLNSISDLLSATVQEMLNKKKNIKKCLHCGRLYISRNRTDDSYCSRKCPEGTGRLCEEEAKEQRKHREKIFKECGKKYDSVRHSLEYKYGGSSEQYLDFLDDYRILRNKVNDGQKNPESLLAWLNDAYKLYARKN